MGKGPGRPPVGGRGVATRKLQLRVPAPVYERLSVETRERAAAAEAAGAPAVSLAEVARERLVAGMAVAGEIVGSGGADVP
jgi:hypothetical protein